MNDVIVDNPIEQGLKPVDKAIIPYKKKLLKLNFMSKLFISVDEGYQKPSQYNFLVDKYNRIFSVKYTGKKLELALGCNFTVFDAKTVIFVYNDKSGTKEEQYYVIDLIDCNGKIVKNIAIQKTAKFDMNKFQEALSFFGNHFQMNLKIPEFKTLVQEYILPKLAKTMYIYKNPGLIKPQTFLMGNALIDKGEIHWADEDGLIATPDKNIFIKVNENFEYPHPLLHKPIQSGKIVAKKFLQNYCESWGKNLPLALLATGHMVMGLYYEAFVKKIGVPILIIGGITGSGKSTLVQNGVAIFGFDDNFLNSGDSTVNGQEGVSQSFNGVNICVDDLLDKILESPRFGASIKKLFKSSTKVKRKSYGQAADLSKPCSQTVFSTNGALPDIPELFNRSNIINILDCTLDIEKFQYFEDSGTNRSELSCILVELLKFDETAVLKIHEELKEKLKQALNNEAMSRIVHNIAYMWTGITLLEEIADYKIENLFEEIIKYAKNISAHYKALPTPVDMLLNGLLTLKNHGVINDMCHYKIRQPQDTEDGRIHLIFHKDTLLTAYNRFFAGDESRKIKTNVFNNYLSVDKRVIRTDFTGYYAGARKNSVVFDVSDWDDVLEFAGVSINPMSYSELASGLEAGNGM